MESKFCKHCGVNHPYTSEFWYKNGGKLYKCKAYYTPVELKAQKIARGISEDYTKEHPRIVREVFQIFADSGEDIAWEVKKFNTRADLVLESLKIIIEIKYSTHVPLDIIDHYKDWINDGYSLYSYFDGAFYLLSGRGFQNETPDLSVVPIKHPIANFSPLESRSPYAP